MIIIKKNRLQTKDGFPIDQEVVIKTNMSDRGGVRSEDNKMIAHIDWFAIWGEEEIPVSKIFGLPDQFEMTFDFNKVETWLYNSNFQLVEKLKKTYSLIEVTDYNIVFNN